MKLPGRRVGTRSGIVATAGLGALVALTVSACGGSGSSAVAVRAGDIEVLHPYLPDPASPSVAAVYLTVRNTGGQPESLTGASSTVSASATLHSETMHSGTMGSGTMGSGTMAGGAETMTPLASLTVPEHGEVALAPGHDHVMLEGLDATLRTGQTVSVTLRFSREGAAASGSAAGSRQVVVAVPVVPLDAAVAGVDHTGDGA